MQQPDELESHLADRLADARDFADFSSSRRAAAGTPEGETVTGREIVIQGAEHLSGRKVQDTFTRGGKRQPVPAPQDLPPRKRKLEHHLESRLKEVSDEMVSDRGDAALRAYQDLRRKLGGS